jgi:hypothetical protein
MIFAGFAGSGILGITLGKSGSLQQNVAFMEQFIPVIAAIYRIAEYCGDCRRPSLHRDIFAEKLAYDISCIN